MIVVVSLHDCDLFSNIRALLYFWDKLNLIISVTAGFGLPVFCLEIFTSVFISTDLFRVSTVFIPCFFHILLSQHLLESVFITYLFARNLFIFSVLKFVDKKFFISFNLSCIYSYSLFVFWILFIHALFFPWSC